LRLKPARRWREAREWTGQRRGRELASGGILAAGAGSLADEDGLERLVYGVGEGRKE
jgi:hypothetical protein